MQEHAYCPEDGACYVRTGEMHGTPYGPYDRVSDTHDKERGQEMYEGLEELLQGDEDFDPDGYGDGSVVATEDGCWVEPDGECPHGYLSPLVRLGFM